ncbi:hypothetical protein MAR_ORF266 [Marseillevirus marseillevirus]|uniref:Uncharacterized protein n=1 Tax=Marseillevirus marseillevirus TaxID=694581 RepID=D2XAR3_GBMV|nr:hypothetical protein MAR_ORF266 [Marseillevirus marseillevirus]ADB04040.1 hypothetical protein MAR_ORF266 [Marseillevirus marseillevirus]
MERVWLDREAYEKTKKKHIETRNELARHKGCVIQELLLEPRELDFLVFEVRDEPANAGCCSLS